MLRDISKDYVDFLVNHGTFHIIDHQGVEWCRLLTPDESLRLMKWLAEYIRDDDMGPSDSDRKAAHAEQAVRRNLYPFQYCEESTRQNLYCFYKSKVKDGLPSICPIAHDDYRVADWIHEEREGDVYTFEKHICRMIDEIMNDEFP